MGECCHKTAAVCLRLPRSVFNIYWVVAALLLLGIGVVVARLLFRLDYLSRMTV